MTKQKFFIFENICTIDNYFIFVESYLKINHILKKDFLEGTKLNAGTYRSFLKNTRRNGKYFYNIVSKYLNIYLPDENRMKELNEEFQTYLYDLLYLKYNKLIEDLDKMQKYFNPKIERIEEIPFILLGTFIRLTINKQNYADEKKIASEATSKVQPYLEILPIESSVFYEALDFLVHSFDKEQAIIIGNQLRMKSRDIDIINGIVLSLISSAMYRTGDYLNSILYSLEANDAFYKQNNYVRLISSQLNLANLYLLVDDYPRGHQVFLEISYMSELLNDRLYERNQRGLLDSLIFMKRYEEAYQFFINEYSNKATKCSSKVEFLYVCYKLNKEEEFKEKYNELIDSWKNNELFEVYYHVAKLINSMYFGKISPNQKEKTLELIKTLKNNVTKKLFSTFFEKIAKK